MNTQQLERLIMDRELGELSEDAEALLAAWLAQHPLEHEEKLIGTLSLARRAVRPKRQTVKEVKPWRWAGMVAAGVACFVLGLMVQNLVKPPTQRELAVEVKRPNPNTPSTPRSLEWTSLSKWPALRQ